MDNKKVDFSKQAGEDAKKHGVGGAGYFEMAEGDNKVRVLSEGIVLASHFLGKKEKPAICFGKDEGCPYHGSKDPSNPQAGEWDKPNLKWLMYVIDRKDGAVKQAKMPWTVFKRLGELQMMEDWAFDGVPMPYDLTISAIGAGTKEVEYAITPSPKREPITAEQMDELAKKMPIDQVVERIKEKAKNSDE